MPSVPISHLAEGSGGYLIRPSGLAFFCVTGWMVVIRFPARQTETARTLTVTFFKILCVYVVVLFIRWHQLSSAK